MSQSEAITQWLNDLKEGDRGTVQRLWEKYFHRLVILAKNQLQGLPRNMADEEDVALSAFKSFCLGAEQKRFPKLADRDDLWQILVMLTRNKSINLLQHATRKKRNVNRLASPEVLSEGGSNGFLQLIKSSEPDPQFVAEMAEECHRLLELLPDEQLRMIAVHKMEGFTNQEISRILDTSLPTVERRLKRVRMLWSQELKTS